METDRGIWKCGNKGRRSGCGFWNVYVGRSLKVQVKPPIPNEDGRGWTEGVTRDKAFILGFRRVDTKCRHCDRRHRFRIVRNDPRGGVRRVKFIIHPSNIAVEALIDEANRLNGEVQLERDDIRFVRAKEYRVAPWKREKNEN